jgi:hypothetical protein
LAADQLLGLQRYPNKTEEDQDTLQEIKNEDIHEVGGVKFPPSQISSQEAGRMRIGSTLSGGEMMICWRCHIASAMVIYMDAQLPSKKGSGGLKCYYVMLLIALIAALGEGTADCCPRHQIASW